MKDIIYINNHIGILSTTDKEIFTKYVRADIYDQLKAENEELKSQVKDLHASRLYYTTKLNALKKNI
jgi:cell division protein FtsB